MSSNKNAPGNTAGPSAPGHEGADLRPGFLTGQTPPIRGDKAAERPAGASIHPLPQISAKRAAQPVGAMSRPQPAARPPATTDASASDVPQGDDTRPLPAPAATRAAGAAAAGQKAGTAAGAGAAPRNDGSPQGDVPARRPGPNGAAKAPGPRNAAPRAAAADPAEGPAEGPAVGPNGPRRGKPGGPKRGRPGLRPMDPANMPPLRLAASAATVKRRHRIIAASFVLWVIVPMLVASWYLYARAADQFASYVGFSVRSEQGTTSSELLGGLGALVGASSSSSSDTDILYKFIQSHDLVQRVDARLNLREIWSKPENDPVFAFTGNDTVEELLAEWDRKVKVYYDGGMIDLRVLAFDPADAQAIAQTVLDEGTVMINRLNDIAREDTLRYAADELDEAVARLKTARAAVTAFRNRYQLVDPNADVQGQVGVVASLQQQLAEALIQQAQLKANAQPSDPRIAQADLRVQVIREQIEAERSKIGSDTATGEALSEVVGQFEVLEVDRQFAETRYTAALAAYDTARAEAARQTRYLAAYVKPTLAQRPEYPERAKQLILIGGFLMLLWMIGVLIFYSVRDRR